MNGISIYQSKSSITEITDDYNSKIEVAKQKMLCLEVGDDDAYKSIAAEIKALSKQKTKDIDQAVARDAAKKTYSALQSHIKNFIDQYDVCSVPVKGAETYFLLINDEWKEFFGNGLKQGFPSVFENAELAVKGCDSITCFNELLEADNRIKFGVYSSIENTEPSKHNIFIKGNWCQPVNHGIEVDDIFSALMTSFTSGDEDFKVHVKKWLIRKITHPEDYLLPALCMYGEGGGGKNLFVDKLLNTIFGGKSVSITADKMTGEFNSLVEGMMVVHLQEVSKKKVDTEKVKAVIGIEYIHINNKYQIPYKQFNYPAYIISSNDEQGAMKLDFGKSDRRYSVKKCHKGFTLDDVLRDLYHVAEPYEWRTEHVPALSDRKQVEQWLYNIYTEVGPQEFILEEFHKDDYDNLRVINKPIEEQVVYAAFVSSAFGFIMPNSLYSAYVDQAKMSGKVVMTPDKFARFVGRYVDDNELNWKKVKQKVPGSMTGSDPAWHWITGRDDCKPGDTLEYDPSTRSWNLSFGINEQ